MKIEKNGRKIIVIGAGPAGLAAAIFAQRAGACVTLLERNAHCGAKLLTTGGGHCNAANLRPAEEWPKLFGKQGRFITPAMRALPREALENWFARLGDPLIAQDGFHLFPQSRSAKKVRDALRDEAESLGVNIQTNTRCTGIIVEDTTATGVRTDSGEHFAEAIIMATGGKSYPATGSDWLGCTIAESLGHKIIPPTPGLAGLRAAAPDPELAGLVLPDATVTFKTKGRKPESGTGELLLTHTGISGPAVLDLSATVCESIGETKTLPATLHIRWTTKMPAENWRIFFEQTRQTRGRASIVSCIHEYLPQRLAKWICAKAEVNPDTPAAALKAARRDMLIEFLGNFPAEITASEGWNKAMITRGGVDLRQVNPETLESRIIANLHFVGEMLNIDGPCGGYNLHWAFASGSLAGESAVSGHGIIR